MDYPQSFASLADMRVKMSKLSFPSTPQDGWHVLRFTFDKEYSEFLVAFKAQMKGLVRSKAGQNGGVVTTWAEAGLLESD